MQYLIYKRDKCPGCKGTKKIKKVRSKTKLTWHEPEEEYDCPMCYGKGYLDELVPLKEAKSELRRLLQVQ